MVKSDLELYEEYRKKQNEKLDSTCPKSPNGTHTWYPLDEGLYDVDMMCTWCRRIVND